MALDILQAARAEPIVAYHASSESFPRFDFRRLGRTTLRNQTSPGRNSWAMNLARLGAWASDSPNIGEAMAADVVRPVRLVGHVLAFDSLEDLEGFVRWQGGPLRARRALLSGGISIVKVDDEEFGSTSYVALSPDVAAFE